MLGKLAYRNTKRNIKDYLIYLITVTTWFDMFADNTYADACLTRITDKHHTYRLEMNGINMRETE